MKKKALCVLGPTASGKSELALRIAEPKRRPIVNVDSIQIYQGVELGSAMPTPEEKARTPHYLYGHVAVGEIFTAADYVDSVRTVLQNSPEEEQWIFCGGSGFYQKALEKGLFESPPVTDLIKTQVGDLIETKGWRDSLGSLNQKSANFSHVHENDHYRIRRGLELVFAYEAAGAEFSQQTQPSPIDGYSLLKIGITADKEQLRERVVLRTQKMLASGWEDEVKALLGQGYGTWPPLSSVGYLQMVQYLQGEIPVAHLEERIVTATMQLIKKQKTWFKKDSTIQWYTLENIESAVQDAQDWLD